MSQYNPYICSMNITQESNDMTPNKRRKESITKIFMDLYEEIKHGDQEHQDWLKKKILDYIDKHLK
jgi:hypothetical protein